MGIVLKKILLGSFSNILICLMMMILLTVTHGSLNQFDLQGTDEQDDRGEQNDQQDPCQVVHKFTLSSLDISLCAHVTKLFLMFESYDLQDIYPPWSYKGIYGPNEWHTLDVQLFNANSSVSFQSLVSKGTTEMKGMDATTPQANIRKAPKRGPPKPKPTIGSTADTHSVTESLSSNVVLDYYGPIPSFMKFGGNLTDNLCDGPMPSPINIDTTKAKVQDSLTEFDFSNADNDYAIRMYFPEDGTNLLTVRVEDAWGTQKAPCISKGSINGPDLCFDRLYIHYGVDGITGSEHTLNGKSFAMEFQFFFTKQDARHRSVKEFYYFRLNEYLTHVGQSNIRGKYVRALSIFVQVVDTGKSDINMRILAELARMFWIPGRDKMIRSYATVDRVFKFKSFFPRSIYYAYKGSLTFPPCFPDLDWVVFDQPISISREDFEAFLFIPSEFDDGYIAGNSRPIDSIYVQLEDRKINKDEGSRTQVARRRKNRELFKSIPPQDTSKEQLYDYYEEESGTISWTKRKSFHHLQILLISTIITQMSYLVTCNQIVSCDVHTFQ